MIYQDEFGFKIFKFKAEADGETQYINNKEDYERDLLQRVKMKSIDNNLENDDSPILPDITYSDIVLSTEQYERFNQLVDIKGITLDEITEYVFSKVEPNNPSYEVVMLREYNSEIVYDSMMKDLKIETLENRNTNLENNLADLLYQLMMGGII